MYSVHTAPSFQMVEHQYLLRVYSWVNRFISDCVEDEKYRVKGGLIKDMVRKEHAKEYLDLQKGKNLSQHSKILGLYPKLDEDGVMRLDTRLQYVSTL